LGILVKKEHHRDEELVTADTVGKSLCTWLSIVVNNLLATVSATGPLRVNLPAKQEGASMKRRRQPPRNKSIYLRVPRLFYYRVDDFEVSMEIFGSGLKSTPRMPRMAAQRFV